MQVKYDNMKLVTTSLASFKATTDGRENPAADVAKKCSQKRDGELFSISLSRHCRETTTEKKHFFISQRLLVHG